MFRYQPMELHIWGVLGLGASFKGKKIVLWSLLHLG